MADLGWSAWAAMEEAANYWACLTAYLDKVAGPINIDVTETCEDGEFACPKCPWKKGD